ncbi:MAG: hydrogenase maturation protease [Sphingobacteriales bacterium]|nr:hydrogenase maturation protease [Sphingobacteriales bacterium]
MEERLLIMGVGNYLMGDEGVGVHAAQKLMSSGLPGYVDVVDGGTGGFHLLEYFEKYPRVILVDATLDGQKAGTIRLIKPRFASDFPKSMSTHDIGLKDMMSSLQLLDKIPEIYLFVVSIEYIQQQGVEMTEEVEAAMPELLNKVTELAVRLSPETATVTSR